MTDLTAIDVCAGCGGLSLGLQRSGFSVLGVERDEDSVATHRANVGPCEMADVTTWEPSGPVDLVAGGVPCQSFSAAGKRAGLDDLRGTLFWHLLRIASASNARAVLLENVRGFVTWNGGEALRLALSAFREHGYEPRWSLVDASDFGVPQRRIRLFIVGLRPGVPFVWPAPSHGPPGNVLGLPAWVTVREALGLGGGRFTTERAREGGGWAGMRSVDVDAPGYVVSTVNNADFLSPLDAVSPTVTASEDKACNAFGSRGAQTSPRRAGDTLNAALSVLDAPSCVVRTNASHDATRSPRRSQRPMAELHHAYSAALDLPAPTVSAGGTGGGGGAEPFANREARDRLYAEHPTRLTVAQLAALQSFPPGFTFTGNKSSQHRQVGNAVPSLLAEAMGRAIRAAISR